MKTKKEPDYITPKLQTAFDNCGVKFMQQVTVNGVPGFVQGIRKLYDGTLKVMVSHKNSNLPVDQRNNGIWKLVEYEPSEVRGA